MAAATHPVDLRDLSFVLFEELALQERLKEYSEYASFDEDFYRSTIEEMARIASEVIAPLNAVGDREGCHFDGKGNVRTPQGFPEAFRLLGEGGWVGISALPEVGGMGLPYTMGVATTELRSGANVAFSIYAGLTHGVGNLIATFGTPWMREVVAPRLYAGTWAGTMLLTESGAGSAVGESRARALPTEEEGHYLVEGEKIFISGGDHDLTENIVHVALARTPDAPAGSHGLSIFLVPKFLIEEDGRLGARNGIVVTGVEEHKMGIHGAATCTIALGADAPCHAWRIGEEGMGMKIMFHLMNEARLEVAIQGAGTASAAYHHALRYAKERLQGSDLRSLRDENPPQVPIVQHPDVRRMLMTMRVLSETLRSFIYTIAFHADVVRSSQDPAERDRHQDLVDLYIPIAKSHGSDMAFEVTRLAIQVLGGYGYISEYPVEQYLRDTKVSSIYEGTNGIQSLDLLGRKMRLKNGMLFVNWLQETTRTLEASKGMGLDDEVAALERARDAIGASAMHLVQMAMSGRTYEAMYQASPYLTQFGTFLLGMHALRQAVVARSALEAGSSETAFYEGKILNLKFYVANLLPNVEALGQGIRSQEEAALDPILFSGE
ncbi:MAG: acyl-CoA dehydrogenase [Deltaproteobacteria bacterium]|nr:acyl-CoA dehydrogenase [Deltaproteobacteria bacterium]